VRTLRAVAVAGLASLLSFRAAAGAGPDRQSVLTRAARHQAAGAHAEAAAALRPYMQEHPADAEAGLLLGQALMESGDTAAAVRAWRRLIEAHADPTPLYRAVIDRLRRGGHTAEAMRFMEEAHRRLGDPRPYVWELAELYLGQQEYDRAVDALLEYVRVEPRRLGLIEGRLMGLVRAEARGRSEAGDGDAAGAGATGLLRALARAAAAARADGGAGPDFLAAHVLLGSVALEAGQARRGLEAYTAIAPLAEAGPLLFQFASRCSAAGRHATAAAAYALFRTHAPDSPYLFQALLRQARAEESAGRPEPAAALYAELAETYPGRPEALEALLSAGRLRLERPGDCAAARAAFETVLAQDRSGRLRPAALQSLADCDLRSGDLEAARDRYEELLAAGAEAVPAARYGLALVALYQGRLEAVAEHGDSLLAHDAADERANDALELQVLVDEFGAQPEALAAYARALFLEKQGRVEEAAVAWQRVTQEGPAALQARGLLRWAEATADPDAALALYDRVRARWPGSPHDLRARLGRAGILERRGDLGGALMEYETALLAFPESARAPEVRLEIERLRRLVGKGATG